MTVHVFDPGRTPTWNASAGDSPGVDLGLPGEKLAVDKKLKARDLTGLVDAVEKEPNEKAKLELLKREKELRYSGEIPRRDQYHRLTGALSALDGVDFRAAVVFLLGSAHSDGGYPYQREYREGGVDGDRSRTVFLFALGADEGDLC